MASPSTSDNKCVKKNNEESCDNFTDKCVKKNNEESCDNFTDKCVKKNNEESCDNFTETHMMIAFLLRLPRFVKKSLALPSHIENYSRGLFLCSSTKKKKDYFIYNYATRERFPLPPPPVHTKTRNCLVANVSAALVFDGDDSSSSNSNVFYRVIRFFSGFRNFDVDARRGLDMCIDIYSSKTGQWAMSKESVQDGPLKYPVGPLVFFDGALYMKCMNTKDGDCLLRFDVREERREFISLPPGELLRWKECLGVCGGRLCYVHIRRVHRMEVWVLENSESGKWALMHDVDNIEDLGIEAWAVNLLAFHRTLNALFLKTFDDDFYWYNFDTGKSGRIVSYVFSTA